MQPLISRYPRLTPFAPWLQDSIVLRPVLPTRERSETEVPALTEVERNLLSLHPNRRSPAWPTPSSNLPDPPSGKIRRTDPSTHSRDFSSPSASAFSSLRHHASHFLSTWFRPLPACRRASHLEKTTRRPHSWLQERACASTSLHRVTRRVLTWPGTPVPHTSVSLLTLPLP